MESKDVQHLASLCQTEFREIKKSNYVLTKLVLLLLEKQGLSVDELNGLIQKIAPEAETYARTMIEAI